MRCVANADIAASIVRADNVVSSGRFGLVARDRDGRDEECKRDYKGQKSERNRELKNTKGRKSEKNREMKNTKGII